MDVADGGTTRELAIASRGGSCGGMRNQRIDPH
jgi:hypothetical protein